MNSKIAEILRDQVIGLAWIDKITGLVQPVTYSDKAGNKKTMPVAINTNLALCNSGDYEEYCPDNSKMSILYFEDEGLDVANAGCRYIDCVSSLKLICWCNLKLINPSYASALPVKLQVIRTIPATIANTDWVTKINIQFAGDDLANPFTKYTYDEQKQYLMWPYDYFALKYKVHFSVPINAECYDEIELNPDICI